MIPQIFNRQLDELIIQTALGFEEKVTCVAGCLADRFVTPFCPFPFARSSFKARLRKALGHLPGGLGEILEPANNQQSANPL